MSKQQSNFTLIVVALLTALLQACGGSSSDGTSSVDFSDSTLASCLKQNGATFAKEPEELSFFSQAEDEDTASMFATTYDESTKLFVQIWKDGDDPREWLMWQAQSFDKSLSPEAIVEDGPEGSYVAFALKPSEGEKSALESCAS
jgi:hypothetical protein